MALIYYCHLGKMRKQNNVERLISGGDDVWLGFKAFSLVPEEQRKGRSGINVASTKHDWLAVDLLQMLNKYSSWLMSRVIDHRDTPEPLLLKQLSLPTDQVSSDTMCIFLNPPHTHTLSIMRKHRQDYDNFERGGFERCSKTLKTFWRIWGAADEVLVFFLKSEFFACFSTQPASTQPDTFFV